jgi:hypothetical protein
MVEALHELTLTLCRRLDKQLGGCHKLARLHGQLLLGAQEPVLVPALRVPGHAEGARLVQMPRHVAHHLLCLAEDEQPSRLLQRIIAVLFRGQERVGLVHARPLQRRVVRVKVTVGVHVALMTIEIVMANVSAVHLRGALITVVTVAAKNGSR